MDLIEAIYTRRAAREFTAEPVARRMLEDLVDAAIQAPSAINAQPWCFTVVQNAALLDRMSTRAKAHLRSTLDLGLAPKAMLEQLDAPYFHIFHHAPALVLISARAGEWATEDAALAAENFMLAACGQGLGTCWIGLAQNWLQTEEGRQAVGLPRGYLPVAPIIVGHPREPAPPIPRNPPDIRWID